MTRNGRLTSGCKDKINAITFIMRSCKNRLISITAQENLNAFKEKTINEICYGTKLVVDMTDLA